MFSLFKKPVTIKSVSIPSFGWQKVKEDATIIQWVNPEQTIAVSVNFFNLKPDLPALKDIDVLRGFYRNMIVGVGGGVVELELYKHRQFDLIRTLFKVPQNPSGITYIASITIPFSTCSFVFKVQAPEIGATGMRETIIMDGFLKTGQDFSSWTFDPYDKDFKEGLLMNISEDKRYDVDFPDHHLTRARKLLNEIESGFTWKPEIEKLFPFDK
jgi:hypothetical protein